MSTLPIELSDDVDALQALVRQQHVQLESHQDRIRLLEEFVRLLQHQRFGRSSEKSSVAQLGLFNEAECALDSSGEEAEEETVSIAAHERKKSGRKPLPSWIPRVEVIHDLPEDEKVCPHDGHALEEMGQEVHEQLEFIPAVLQVLRHIRPKYACPQCRTGIRIAPAPPQLIPKSIATPSLLAHVAVSKYADALPLYRQEKMLGRGGIELPRATLANWMVKAGQAVQPLINLMREEMLAGDILQCDETRFQVLHEPGRRATSQSYLWVQRGGTEETPLVVYDYDPSRSGEVPKRLLEGFSGYLQTDGYEGYTAVCSAYGLTHVGCWAHARRKFDEALKAQGKNRKKGSKRDAKASKALQGLSFIRQLYRIERQIKDQPPDERQRIRQERSEPVIQELRAWLDASIGSIPPESLTGQALGYLKNQWPKLIRVLEDGRLRIDTNLVENAIRPFVLGRKNWMFADTVHGAQASANLYSIIETAKANGLEPYAYLHHIFTELPEAKTLEAIEELLPHRINSAQLKGSGKS